MDAKYLPNAKLMNSTINASLAHANAAHSFCFPEDVTITTTYRCNYRCRMCYQKDYTGEIDWKVYERLEPILPFAERLQVFGGEPLIYPRITEVYELAHKHGCQITMVSNGSMLTDKMVESILDNNIFHIKFSIDAGTPKTYKHIRGGDFFKVIKGVARITQGKLQRNTPFPDMHFNFLAMRSNIAELPKLVTIAREVGVAQINVFYPSCHTEELVDDCVYFCQEESDAWLRQAKILADGLGVNLNLPPLFSDHIEEQPNKGNRFCKDPWTKLLVDINGRVTLCCGGSPAIGNIFEQDFDEMWNGPVAQKLRSTVNTPQEPAYCRNCRIRKPVPSGIELHIQGKELQEYGLKKFGMLQPAEAL